MGYLGRRIGKSQNTARGGDGADGNLGGGILDLFEQGYFAREGNINRSPGIAPSGLSATGGVISDYTSGSDVFRAHIFTSSGTLTVTALGDEPAALDYLVVAGGGGGGSKQGGGGGAGGLRSNFPGVPSPLRTSTSITATAGPTSYPIVVGGGGVGGSGDAEKGNSGSNSVLTYPGPNTITSHGGGGGGSGGGSPPYPGLGGVAGGSGGGGAGWGAETGTGGGGNNPPFPVAQGTAGGAGGSNGGGNKRVAGGGGGFTASGTDGAPLLDPNVGAPGGAGISLNITGITTAYAGGGGGGVYGVEESSPTRGLGGSSVGGEGNNEDDALHPYMNAVFSSGSGGGGGGGGPQGGSAAGNGSSGIIVVRYKIGTVDTGSAKASGGAITFYGGKTIHTFTSAGTFTAPSPLNPSPLSVECFIVAGGGGGGSGIGGGGGAGGVVYKPGIPITLGNSYTINVGAGGVGSLIPNSPTLAPQLGTDTTALGLTAKGGGGGGNGQGGDQTGDAGGSSGGTGSTTGSDPAAASQPGTSNPGAPINVGNVGGPGASTTNKGGGGGGAGGAATGEPMPATGTAGVGGLAIQAPPAFRDPAQRSGPTPDPFNGGGLGYPGPGSTFHWFAGGGGGGAYNPGPATGGGGGGGTFSAPFGGAGNGRNESNFGQPAGENSGSGGGGGGYESSGGAGGNGGSGIVLIAYPS